MQEPAETKTPPRSLETAYGGGILLYELRNALRTEHIQHVLPSEIKACKHLFTL